MIIATIQPNVPVLSRFSIFRFIPNFLAGLIAFTLPRVLRIKAFVWPVFLLGLIAVFILKPTQMTGWALCLALGMLIPFFAEITTGWIRIASKHIAMYSYGIYLSHQFSIWIALGLLGPQSPWLQKFQS